MVRCSTKRIIKIVLGLILLRLLVNVRWSTYLNPTPKSSQINPKNHSIVILSSNPSKVIQRLMLFLNELRLPYIQRHETDHFAVDYPSILIFEHPQTPKLSHLIRQHSISTLMYLNDQCSHCKSISLDSMLFENTSYPTMDFHRDHLKPVRRMTSSPFRIEPSNNLITLLRFDEILPYFHPKTRLKHQCWGLPDSAVDPMDTVIYVRDKRTLEKVHLMAVLERNVQISSCLDAYWFIWPIVMDTLKYLSSGHYNYYGFRRHIQVDIDDMFLGGKSNDHLNADDIRALIRSQTLIQKYVPQFRYRLGFSGSYFNSSTEQDNQGDQLLIRK